MKIFLYKGAKRLSPVLALSLSRNAPKDIALYDREQSRVFVPYCACWLDETSNSRKFRYMLNSYWF